ncbi:MAG: PHP domain-containing protein [Planctomycetes bacterium]|nr:PHP domain-containing protein [Planctomycetota bacterium]
MKIDLHIHTREGSDGRATAEQMIEAAIERGLHGLVITDHDCMLSVADQQRLQQRHPRCKVFRGCEATLVGTGEHIGVIGGSLRDIPPLRPEELSAWGSLIRAAGALTILNHPFDNGPELSLDLDSFCPDAMEFLSMNVNTALAAEFTAIARSRGMRPVAGSDAHKTEHVGMFYVELDRDITCEDALVSEILAGRYALASFPGMWNDRMAEAVKCEAAAREILRAGGTIDDYLKSGNFHPAFFHRVAENGSYIPREEFLGLRGDDFTSNKKDQ